VSCSGLQWVAVSCSELQWAAVSCSELQWVAVSCSELQWVAVSCSDLQWVAVSCSELQWVAVSCSVWSTHCNTLQHTATRCNTHLRYVDSLRPSRVGSVHKYSRDHQRALHSKRTFFCPTARNWMYVCSHHLRIWLYSFSHSTDPPYVSAEFLKDFVRLHFLIRTPYNLMTLISHPTHLTTLILTPYRPAFRSPNWVLQRGFFVIIYIYTWHPTNLILTPYTPASRGPICVFMRNVCVCTYSETWHTWLYLYSLTLHTCISRSHLSFLEERFCVYIFWKPTHLTIPILTPHTPASRGPSWFFLRDSFVIFFMAYMLPVCKESH